MNILLTESGRAKLCDFGLAKIKTSTISNVQLTTAVDEKKVGTLQWMAPEILGPKAKYSTQSDVYAYGIVLWEIAARKIPYKEVTDDFVLIEAILEGEREEIPEKTPLKFANLIKFCWAQKPEERPQVEKVLEELEECRNELRK